MDLKRKRTFIERFSRALVTCGVKVPSMSVRELKKIFLASGGSWDEKVEKLDLTILLDEYCMKVIAARKNGGITQEDLKTNKMLCSVLTHIINAQKKKLTDGNEYDNEEVFDSLKGYKRTIEVVCPSSRQNVQLKRTEIHQEKKR